MNHVLVNAPRLNIMGMSYTSMQKFTHKLDMGLVQNGKFQKQSLSHTSNFYSRVTKDIYSKIKKPSLVSSFSSAIIWFTVLLIRVLFVMMTKKLELIQVSLV